MTEEYTIPVRIKIEHGRYKYGHVKTLTPNSRGNVRVKYGGGRIAERSADSVEYEPRGFHVKSQTESYDSIQGAH